MVSEHNVVVTASTDVYFCNVPDPVTTIDLTMICAPRYPEQIAALPSIVGPKAVVGMTVAGDLIVDHAQALLIVLGYGRIDVLRRWEKSEEKTR